MAKLFIVESLKKEELTDYEVVVNEVHSEMIKRHHLWPHRPFLPITKNNDKDFGVIHESSKTKVYLILLPFLLLVNNIQDIPSIEYYTVENLIKDGWIVD